MLKQLQEIYPSIIYQNQIKPNDSINNYIWFINDDKEIFGIAQEELTEKDISLLSTFLKIYHHLLPDKTEKEKYWYNLVHQKSNEIPKTPYRFIYFTMQKNQINPITFKKAIAQVFGKPISILWESETHGLLIEDITLTHPQMDYEQIINILMSDLSVRIKFYIGDIKNDIKNLSHYYTTLIKDGKTIFSITSKEVISYLESIPYLLLHQLEDPIKNLLMTTVLQKYLQDEEMLNTLKMFFQYNLNVSETAKKMYIHRNTLQYRIDKFSNDTGVNIQKFDQAITVKLALLAKES